MCGIEHERCYQYERADRPEGALPRPRGCSAPRARQLTIALGSFLYLGISLTVALLGRVCGLSESVNEVPMNTCSDPLTAEAALLLLEAEE
jgi:hypothetical protein